MNIKRTIDKNHKLIGLIIIGIIFILFLIKALNAFYERQEEQKQAEIIEKNNQTNNVIEETKDYSIESNSIEKTMESFLNYCNNRELENAYKMLTEECKEAMFPTLQDFETMYINNVYNIERNYEMVKWYTNGNKHTYQVKLYGDLLATGNANNYKEEYYTFIQNNDGFYKLNVNNYIYGEKRNLKDRKNNISIEIKQVDVYEQYETATIKITNNSAKTICLTGDTYRKNIYLQNKNEITYSSLNSEFDNQEIILNPKEEKTFKIDFNKMYTGSNEANFLVLSDVILDYENQTNRTSIKVKYQK